MENEDEGGDSNSQFTDVPEGAWYYDAVLWAAENGIVQGVGGDAFAPERNISRQEMAVMLRNYAAYKACDMPVYRDMPTFTDHDRISLWAMSAVKELSEAGVLSGINNAFAPQSTATRAEVAQMIKNFLRFVVE